MNMRQLIDIAAKLLSEADGNQPGATRSSALRTKGEHPARGPLPASQENIASAKRFVFAKWVERARELGHDEPVDLTSACKFASLFAAEVFGGQLRGHFFHQWVELPDGQTLDLNDDARDVAMMLGGEIPPEDRDYAELSGKKLPASFYTHDVRHMRSRDNRASMASIKPRVDRWVAEFLGMGAPHRAQPST